MQSGGFYRLNNWHHCNEVPGSLNVRSSPVSEWAPDPFTDHPFSAAIVCIGAALICPGSLLHTPRATLNTWCVILSNLQEWFHFTAVLPPAPPRAAPAGRYQEITMSCLYYVGCCVCSFEFKHTMEKDGSPSVDAPDGRHFTGVLYYLQYRISAANAAPASFSLLVIRRRSVTWRSLSNYQTNAWANGFRSIFAAGELGARRIIMLIQMRYAGYWKVLATSMTWLKFQAGGCLRPRNQVHTFWNSGNSSCPYH